MQHYFPGEPSVLRRYHSAGIWRTSGRVPICSQPDISAAQRWSVQPVEEGSRKRPHSWHLTARAEWTSRAALLAQSPPITIPYCDILHLRRVSLPQVVLPLQWTRFDFCWMPSKSALISDYSIPLDIGACFTDDTESNLFLRILCSNGSSLSHY